MFAKLWKRTPTEASDASFEFSVERQRGEPIRFNGTLQVESIGEAQSEHRPGDPWHRLRVYQSESGAYVVVIEFDPGNGKIAVDAGIVDSVADVDDFFCMHAGEHFHRMALGDDREGFTDAGSSTSRDTQLEQRVLAKYDRQILDVVNWFSSSKCKDTYG